MEGFYVVALSPTRNGFFDPVSRINLSRMSPQGIIPVGSPISGALRSALRSGGIVDMTGELLAKLQEEEPEQPGVPPRQPTTAVLQGRPAEQPQPQETSVAVAAPVVEPEVPAGQPEVVVTEQETPVQETPAKVEVEAASKKGSRSNTK